MFNGKIAGLTIAKECGKDEVEAITSEWYAKAEVLKSHPGEIKDYQKDLPETGVFPVIHCIQEIPCNILHNCLSYQFYSYRRWVV